MPAVVVAAARVLSSSSSAIMATDALGLAVGTGNLILEVAPGIGMLLNLYMLCTPTRVAFHMCMRLLIKVVVVFRHN
jgi:hypothetical protein